MVRLRFVAAISLWSLVALGIVVPLVWLINNRDWGVALMLLVPFIVYGLMRLGRSLEAWANAAQRP
ncbi:hypothetical protein E0L35_17745 [Halomonas sp. ATBC28]|jgi:hypothetical protein|uniref:Uncharacterized protein n=1 Tax=Vreelandella titanicae TaxID=664683 RepID=A0A6N0YX54_9GAMM|nr:MULTISPECIES: hypothetical protein [Halomonas]NAO97060.1 hypothetical protein [Halomonas sp. MG34]QGQ70496.1 hypothetical protein FDY98_11525 [Halomonas sp. PA16-9]UEQ06344.1 hypothetical protein LMS44_10870 [Halomonas profundus]KIN15002.1 hypothetical protein RO22_12590 [Halomonas sp. KHS3]NVE89866.1 hypothetical protein [Halomonas titanicae]|tara:strand:+ start:2210 stop:2407 length:198 start_codon:yes stop_codon:yes gene_type:complete